MNTQLVHFLCGKKKKVHYHDLKVCLCKILSILMVQNVPMKMWWNVALVRCRWPDAAPHGSQLPLSARGFIIQFSTFFSAACVLPFAFRPVTLSRGMKWTPFPISFTAVNKWLQEVVVGGGWLGLDVLFLCTCSCKQFLVEVGVDKPGVRVVLHQAVDLLLSCQEACCCGVIETLNDVISRLIIQVYL